VFKEQIGFHQPVAEPRWQTQWLFARGVLTMPSLCPLDTKNVTVFAKIVFWSPTKISTLFAKRYGVGTNGFEPYRDKIPPRKLTVKTASQ
jgi:hypothetical protein